MKGKKRVTSGANDMDDLPKPCSSSFSSLNQEPQENKMENEDQPGEGKVVVLRSPKTIPLLLPEVKIGIEK